MSRKKFTVTIVPRANKETADIDFLRGKADIAVIGTHTIRVMEEEGTAAVGDL